MKLTVDQIRAVAIGTAYVNEDETGIHLHRFTAEQEELYRVTNKDFYMKSFSTAGIRLEMTTNSRTLRLAVTVSSGSSRKFFHHDVFVDGKLIGQLKSTETNCGEFDGEFDLGEGEKKLAVYFPWSCASVIRSFELEDGATVTPVKKSCRMIIYGDSITHGYDAIVPAQSYASLLADALDADARNKGIGGERFFPALAEISDDYEPDYITVAYGTNDWSGKTLEEFENNSRAFYTLLSKKYPSTKIFALAPIWRGDMDRETKVGSFYHVAEHLGAVADELPNVTLINCFDFVPKSPEYFSDKHLHPNDEGFRYYFEGLLAEIKKYL